MTVRCLRRPSRSMNGAFDVDTTRLNAWSLASHLGGGENAFRISPVHSGEKEGLRFSGRLRPGRHLGHTDTWRPQRPVWAGKRHLFRCPSLECSCARCKTLVFCAPRNPAKRRQGPIPTALGHVWLAQKSAGSHPSLHFGGLPGSGQGSDFSEQARNLTHELRAVAGAGGCGAPPEARRATWIGVPAPMHALQVN